MFANTVGLGCFADAVAKSDRSTIVLGCAGMKRAFKIGGKAHKVTVELVNQNHPYDSKSSF